MGQMSIKKIMKNKYSYLKHVTIETNPLVKYLVEQGVDVNKENKYKETLLFLACRNGNKVIVECLVEHGPSINKRCNKFEKPTFNFF